MKSFKFLIDHYLIHPDWYEIINQALLAVDPAYLKQLNDSKDWLPGKERIFSAFSQPLSSIRYILLGESPYPRPESANGYAFWDAAVNSLWSDTGLSKDVNRATSLRNLIKMLLYARGDLIDDFSQNSIAQLDKSTYVQTGHQLFNAFLKQGFLMLNASLVYSQGKIPFHAKQWQPFIHHLLTRLSAENQDLQLILLGRIAAQLPCSSLFSSLVAEHPYNISFITNPDVITFFKPLDILGEKYD